jgi:hypothetical protein
MQKRQHLRKGYLGDAEFPIEPMLYLFMKRDFETLQDVPLDAPLRLGIAARLAYPDGSMTASGLRKEAGRGRLAIERVAGKDCTTLTAIAEMRKKCLLEPKGRGSGLGRNADQPVENSSPERPGSSSTLDAISPQDALRVKLQLRKHGWPSTSPPNTGHGAKNGTLRKSKSPTC